MSSFAPKLVEVLSLEQDNLMFLLRIKAIFANQDIFLDVEIDEETFYQIREIITFEDNTRYRISMQYIWNPFKNEYSSSITKSRGSLVEMRDFSCSKNYVNIIETLKCFQETKNLASATNLENIRITRYKGRENTSKHHFHKFITNERIQKYSKLTTIIIGAILILTTLNHVLIHLLSDDRARASIDINSEIQNQPFNKDSEESKTEVMKVVAEEKMIAHSFTTDDDYPVDSNILFGLPDGYAAITFDDGPTQYTKEIIDILEKHEAKATFFFLGINSRNFPDALDYAKSKKMGIGNHSWDHQVLTKITADQQIQDLLTTNTTIMSNHDDKIKLFRPPYGEFDDTLLQTVAAMDMKMVMWNRDPMDWKLQNQDELLQHFYDSDPSGAIYLLHEKRNTVDALPKILEYFKKKNIKLVVLR